MHGGHANEPGTLLGVIGPALPLLVAMPGIWVVCTIITGTPAVAPVAARAVQSRCHCFVAQDFLRFGAGTLTASGVGLRLLYVVAAVLVPGKRR